MSSDEDIPLYDIEASAPPYSGFFAFRKIRLVPVILLFCIASYIAYDIFMMATLGWIEWWQKALTIYSGFRQATILVVLLYIIAWCMFGWLVEDVFVLFYPAWRLALWLMVLTTCVLPLLYNIGFLFWFGINVSNWGADVFNARWTFSLVMVVIGWISFLLLLYIRRQLNSFDDAKVPKFFKRFVKTTNVSKTVFEMFSPFHA